MARALRSKQSSLSLCLLFLSLSLALSTLGQPWTIAGDAVSSCFLCWSCSGMQRQPLAAVVLDQHQHHQQLRLREALRVRLLRADTTLATAYPEDKEPEALLSSSNSTATSLKMAEVTIG